MVAKYYHFESVLGYGASGKVYLVYHRVTGEKFACKVIKKDGQMNDAESMNTEIEIMKRVRHDNIVTLYELFESAKCMWLILELVDGTGLRGGLAQITKYTEAGKGWLLSCWCCFVLFVCVWIRICIISYAVCVYPFISFI